MDPSIAKICGPTLSLSVRCSTVCNPGIVPGFLVWGGCNATIERYKKSFAGFQWILTVNMTGVLENFEGSHTPLGSLAESVLLFIIHKQNLTYVVTALSQPNSRLSKNSFEILFLKHKGMGFA